MKKIITILAILLLTNILFAAITENQIKENENNYISNTLKIAKEFPIPDYYYSKNPDGSYFIYDSQPEIAIGMHQLDIDQTGADQMKDVNIKFVRTTLYWKFMLDDPTYKDDFHSRVDTLIKNGLIPVVVVHSQPDNYSYANKEECYKAFADFMVWAVNEYKDVRYWQLWNEMDANFTDVFGWKIKNSEGKEMSLDERGKNYVDMLKLAYPAIKKANPDAVVLLGPQIYIEFLESVYKAGGKDYFDVVTLHSYSTPTKWEFIRKGLMAKTYMKKYGDINKPLWNTEFGTEAGKYINTYGGLPKTDPLGTFDRMQRDEIAECININNVLGLYNKSFIFQYLGEPEGGKKQLKTINYPEGDDYMNYGFSIVNFKNRTPRPAFTWLVDNQPNKYLDKTRKVKVKIGKFNKEVEINPYFPTRIKVK